MSINTEVKQPHLRLDAAARTYISRQTILFESMLPELLQEYSGQWVLLQDGQIIDADRDCKNLLTRVKQTVGDKIVLVKKVESTISQS
jgi:hypothetical protein